MRTSRRTVLAAIGGGSITGLSGCSALGLDIGGEPCSGPDCDVGMSRNDFLPRAYEIDVGETVVWKNTSSARHTVTATHGGIPEGAAYFASGGFESYEEAESAWYGGRGSQGGIDRGETFSHTFEVPGEYRYVCIPHLPGMVGTIVVNE